MNGSLQWVIIVVEYYMRICIAIVDFCFVKFYYNNLIK